MLLHSTWNLYLPIFTWLTYVATGLKESVRLNRDEGNCMSELMSTRYLSDDQFSASNYSTQKKYNHRPSAARLLHIHSQSDSTDGSAWCPETLAHKEINEWIEVDFRRMIVINQIYTMGRGDGNYREFTPQIIIKYQRSDKGPWLTYRSKQKTILLINTDARTKIRSALQTIIAKRIRIYPLDTISGPRSVCLKFAFLGCNMEDEAMSYTCPQGDSITIGNNVSVDLRDDVYDGQISHTLSNGLGLLMDNNVWRKEFNISKAIKNSQMGVFTGWSCLLRKNNPYINMTFNFEQERDFHSLILYSVKDMKHNVYISGTIVVSIGKNNEFSHITANITNSNQHNPDAYERLINIFLKNLKGDTLTISIICDAEYIILLSEIQIISNAAKSIRTEVSNRPNQPIIHDSFNATDKHTTSLFPDYHLKDSLWRQQDTTVIAMVVLVVLLLIFIVGMVVMCCKFQRSRRNKLAKKLEMVAHCNNESMCHQTPVTVFTIQSKTPAMTSVQQPKYFNDTKTAYSAAYSGSQPSEGVYASWPNTDEDADLATIDKEEEKCLLGTEVGERSSMKEYATYQCGMTSTAANEYIISDGSMYRPQVKTRPSSIVTTLPNLSTLSVPLLKMTSYEIPKSTPIVTYKSNKKHIPSNLENSYQHFLNYRSACGDVDFRYHSSYCRVDQTNLESNIKVIPIASLLPIQTLIRGEFGAISICKMLTDADPKAGSCFFVKNINSDSKSSTKSSFIMDLKIFSSINCANIAKLEAIAIDSEMTSNDLVSIIKSTRFYILIDYLNGYNLKDFLRNTYYSNVSQEFKSNQSYSQISVSSLLIIITQIANGMKHFEDLGLTHRDLACRNCIIDVRMHVKIYPGGWVTAKPNEDYCSIELVNHLVMFPLRWMAPESIIGGVFTIKSDVWSFAVTLWEIFTLCSLVPYGSLTNEALLDLMSHKNNTPRLPCPQSCPKEIFDLMSQCWNWDEPLRPKFAEIHKFLTFKTTSATNQAQIFLPAPPPDDKKS